MSYHDRDTGLIEEKFVKLYYEDISKLLELNTNEMKVLISHIRYLNYTDNIVMLTPEQKQAVQDKTALSDGSYRNATSQLVKKGLYKRLGQGVFQINPDIIYKGKQGSRARLIIDYYEDGSREMNVEEVEEEI